MYDWIGISCGVLAACFFAISYLVSGHALRKFKVTSLQLLALSSFWQGLIAFSILYFIWEPLVKPTDTILALWVTFLGYVFAQFLFFWTLRFISASRIAPLMGVKIIMVFIIALILFEETFTTKKGLAILAIVFSAYCIQQSTTPVSIKGLLGILASITCFGISDTGVKLLTISLQETQHVAPGILGAVLATCMGFMVSSLLLLPKFKIKDSSKGYNKFAFIHAISWMLAIMFLFISIDRSGVVTGIILQALRGPISIILAVVAARFGLAHLEEKQSKTAYLKQFIASLSMIASIAWFVVS